MAKQKEAWDKLSMQEKAQLIKLSIDNGVSSLKQIRNTYNLYANGGKKSSAVDRPRDIDEAIYISRNTPYNKNIDDVEGPGYREYMWKLAQAKSKVWGISPEEAYESFIHPSEFNYRRWYNLASQDELDNTLTNGDAHWMDVFGKTVGADTFSNESPYSGYSNPYNPKGITGGTWTGRLGIDEYIPSESQIDNDWPLNKAWFAIDRGNKYYQEKISKGEDTHEVPSIMTYNNGVMLPEITVTPRGNYIEYYPYANGGQEEILNKVNSSNANFVQRLKDPNRKNIPDWESPTDRISTHKLGVGTDENGNHYIFPEVQEINGELIDFTRPPYHRFAGEISAEMRGDTVRVPSIEEGIKFTETYKQYYPLNSGGSLLHKKSGEEQGETSWLNNGYNSSEDWQLQMKMQTNQMLQNLQNSPFYMTDQEMQNLEFTRMQEAMNNNPSSEFITYTGFDNNGNEITKRLPATKGLNTMMDAGVVDYMPTLGDAKQAVEAVVAAKQGDYLTAGLLGGMMFLPNIIEKPLKKWKKVRNLTKELKERPLQQVIDDEEINAWLAENWYKNEIHNARPVLKSRTVSIDDFDKNGMPLHYKLGDDLPTLKRGNDNILIHVDSRLPLQAGRKGFLPLDGYTGDSPAIWWQRDYPYYTEPSSLSFSGHTLKVKEGDVIPLEPQRRYPNSPGPIVVTEGVLPYNILEGYKWNSDQSWFERERFAPAKSILDYFKYNNLPEWFTYSTGGPLYPFSFEKNPFLKTPIVRY